MLVTLFGITTFSCKTPFIFNLYFKLLEIDAGDHFLLHQFSILPVKLIVPMLQPLKAEPPMLVTLLPIVTEVKLVIPLQSSAGIISTSFPKVNEVTWLPKL